MTPAFTGSQILVVDDDLISRTALSGVLRHVPGLDVVQVADGLAAWELLESGLRPQVCCTDLGMPGLDGLGLMDRIRAHPILNDLPVVMITGTADRATVLAAMQRGAAGYIVKPFVAVDTLGTVQRILRSAALRHAEAPATTRARLHQDAATLGRLLASLRDQARALGEQFAGTGVCGKRQADGQSRMEGLRSGCLTLGLWRGAELIEGHRVASTDPAQLQMVLREVGELACVQLRRLGLPEGLTA